MADQMQTTQVHAVNRDATNCLQVRETELPAPPAGQVRVRVEAAGVSYGDLLFQRGVVPGGPKPPFVPGCDLVGVVDEVGAGVTGLAPGQRVCALVDSGGYADGITLPAARLVPVPDGVSAIDAAAVSLNYFIATRCCTEWARSGAARGSWCTAHQVAWAWPSCSWPNTSAA